MEKMVGIIPAAGKGVRARPYTSLVPKGMLQIAGKPNIERIINLMRDSLQIEDIFIVVGYLGDIIKEYFQDGRRFGVRLHYIENRNLERGLAWSILLAGQKTSTTCCVILSDECYIGSNHKQILQAQFADTHAVCTVMAVDDPKIIRRNYAVKLSGSRIVRLTEKPVTIENDLLGCGTFLLNPPVFELLAGEFRKATDNYVEFVTFLDKLCSIKPGVACFKLNGTYVNINDRDSLNLARFHERNRSFSTKNISLILYSEGTEDNLAFTVQQYRKIEAVTSIHVVLPSENSISHEINESNVNILTCPPELTLYGEKLKYAMDNASGDILILAEAAYTFPAHDIEKLLCYLKEADMVAGTRTTRQLIAQGSDMRGIVRFANIFLAKLLELLWWSYEPRFTDVGCTFRAVWHSSYKEIQDQLKEKGPSFLTEMVIEILRNRYRIVEIPVNYSNKSLAMHAKYRNYRTFFAIFKVMIKKRLQKSRH
jgi:NDP-sugar pyrophosphorylase family protein